MWSYTKETSHNQAAGIYLKHTYTRITAKVMYNIVESADEHELNINIKTCRVCAVKAFIPCRVCSVLYRYDTHVGARS